MKKGFTLIELLVVVLIIGILTAIALPQYQAAVARARYVQLITHVKVISDAEERFWLANGEYTGDQTALDVSLPSGGWYIDARKGIEAVVSHYENMEYVIYLRQTREDVRGRVQCRVFNDDKVVHQVCRNMGGVYVGDSGPYQTYAM